MDTKKGVVHILPLLVVALFISGFVLTTTLSSFSNSQKPSVLSSDDDKDDDDHDNSGSGSSNSGSDKSEDDKDDDNSGSGSSGSDNSGSSHEKDEVDVRIETTSDGVQTKTRVEEDRERTDVYVGGVKYRVETRDGETTFKVEDEDETEDVATESGNIRRFNVRNRTNFPLSVNTETDQLVISTPNGERTVFLPSIAIRNLIDNGLFDDVVLEDSTNPASIDESEFDIFEDEEGELVFEVDTVDNQRFLGLFNILINRTVRFSAENGNIVSSQTPLLERLLDVFSF